MCVLDIQELYTIGEKLHFNPIRSNFVTVFPLLFSSPLFNSKHENAFHWELLHFLHMLDEIKVSCMVKIQDTLLLASIDKKCRISQ
jgi:hypothetical protein